jgi:predicted RNase H-like HicB family nuclease
MNRRPRMVNVIVRPAEEGGFWAEVMELPGCVTQGESESELWSNLSDAIAASLDAGTEPIPEGLPQPQLWKIGMDPLVPTPPG